MQESEKCCTFASQISLNQVFMKKFFSLVICVMAFLFTACEPKVQFASSCIHSGHEYVDLGLSVQWATCNVGAESPTEYGDYFAWGETETKDAFSYENYTFNLSPDVLTRGYDAATVNWGNGWRMPSKQEARELCDECTFERKKINGVAGLWITGPNGNSIFMPANGQKDNYDVEGSKTEGYYWTTVLDDWFGFNTQAYCICFANYSDGVTSFSCSMNFRELGMGIRPVYDPED